MKMTEIAFGAQPPVDGYGAGGFRIGGVWYDGSVVLGADGVFTVPEIGESAWQAVLASADRPDVVLVGQGAAIAPLPAALRTRFEEAGIGVEVMATPSACRTYNVLLAEGRRVSAVLKAV